MHRAKPDNYYEVQSMNSQAQNIILYTFYVQIHSIIYINDSIFKIFFFVIFYKIELDYIN